MNLDNPLVMYYVFITFVAAIVAYAYVANITSASNFPREAIAVDGTANSLFSIPVLEPTEAEGLPQVNLCLFDHKRVR